VSVPAFVMLPADAAQIGCLEGAIAGAQRPPTALLREYFYSSMTEACLLISRRKPILRQLAGRQRSRIYGPTRPNISGSTCRRTRARPSTRPCIGVRTRPRKATVVLVAVAHAAAPAWMAVAHLGQAQAALRAGTATTALRVDALRAAGRSTHTSRLSSDSKRTALRRARTSTRRSMTRTSTRTPRRSSRRRSSSTTVSSSCRSLPCHVLFTELISLHRLSDYRVGRLRSRRLAQLMTSRADSELDRVQKGAKEVRKGHQDPGTDCVYGGEGVVSQRSREWFVLTQRSGRVQCVCGR
jgi:hypothetical protein